MSVREPRAIYVPIFDSFFESSIMNEAVVTRFVFLALVRLASRPRARGIVDVDPRIFAASINVPHEDVETAINRLMEPDPESGSKLEEGRRIVPIDPSRPMRGWRLVNWDGYRKLLHRSNEKFRKAEQRSRDKTGHSGQNTHVTHDTKQYDTKQEEKKEGERRPSDDGRFVVFWVKYPRRVKKQAAIKAWAKLSGEDRDRVVAVLPSWPFDLREDGRFVPHPASWLNERRWEDETTGAQPARKVKLGGFGSEE